jgi:dCTP deaminase
MKRSQQKAPQIYHSISLRINAFKEKLSSFQFVKYPPSSGPPLTLEGDSQSEEVSKKAIKLFENACILLEKELEELRQQWASGRRKCALIESEMLRSIGFSIVRLCPLLECLESSRYERSRPEIIIPFKLLIGTIIDNPKQEDILFCTSFDFNFEYKELINEVTSRLYISKKAKKEFLKKNPGKIALIYFPIIEKENILPLSILAHELGHYVDYRKDNNAISKRPAISSLPRNRVKNWIDTAEKLEILDKKRYPLKVRKAIYQQELQTKLYSAYIWLRELTADKIATRLVGIAYYLSVKEMFRLLDFPPGDYPPNFRRLYEISKELVNPIDGIEKDLIPRMRGKKKSYPQDFLLLTKLKKELDDEKRRYEKLRSYKPARIDNSLGDQEKKEILSMLALNIIEETIQPALLEIDKIIKTEIPLNRCNKIEQDVFEAISYLKADIPPTEIIKDRIFGKIHKFDLKSILLSTGLAWHFLARDLPNKGYYEKLKNLSKLSLRAIELSHLHSKFPGNFEESYKKNKKMMQDKRVKRTEKGVLSKTEILHYLNNDLGKAIIIMPLFSPEQIGESSLDVRLGNCFIISKRASIRNIEVSEDLDESQKKEALEAQEMVYVNPDDKKHGIVLHPGQFILGSTMEYIKLPKDIMAYVIGKSSVGRLGLVIATATQIGPGYKGTPALELSNIGNVPLILHPNELIAQLVFHKLSSPVKEGYDGSYNISVGPDYSKYLKLEFKST